MARQCGEVDLWVGRAVARVRQQKGLSQSAMAKALGISFQQVQKYEAGQNRLSAGRLYEIAKLTGCPVSDFYPREDQTASPSVLMVTHEGRRLLEHFPRIEDRELRRSLAHIVEALALA